MHIVIASVSAAHAPSGVCRHAASLAAGLHQQPEVRRVTLLTGAWQQDYFCQVFALDPAIEIVPIAIRNSMAERNAWYLFTLPKLARSLGADILHLSFPVPILASGDGPSVVLSLHDLYPFDLPQNFGRHKAWLNRAALRVSLRAADAVACVSAATQARLAELFPRIGSRAVTVPNAVRPLALAETGPLPTPLEDQRFLLCVAQHRPNKNLPLLLRGFRLARLVRLLGPETKLAIVGDRGPETEALLDEIDRLDLAPHVVLLQGLEDATMAALYRGARLVVSPSTLEGFGLSVAEALAYGCRVLCSNIPAHRDLAGGHGTFFDLDCSGAALAEGIGRALATAPPQLEKPLFLTPAEAAASYVGVYRQLLHCDDRTPELAGSAPELSAASDR